MRIGSSLVIAWAIWVTQSTAHAGWAVSVGIGGHPHTCRPYYRPYHPCFVSPYRPYYPVAVPVSVYVPAQPVYVAVPSPPPAQPPLPIEETPRLAPLPRPVPPVPAPEGDLPPEPVRVEPTVAVSKPRPVTVPIESLLRGLSQPDETARMASVEQLGATRSPRAVDPLAATLAGDRSAGVRYAAATALGRLGSLKAMPALFRAASYDVDGAVREAATDAIAALREKDRQAQ